MILRIMKEIIMKHNTVNYIKSDIITMNSIKPLLQVISTSPSDSRNIALAGADRIELVSALEIGGITPSQALVRRSLEIVDIPTMIMVRHHNLGFKLNPEQKKLLVEEAISLCDLGAKGLVVGAINSELKVDTQFLSSLKSEISNKIDITFHKASDETNLVETYETLRKYEIRRVLTQGGKKPIEENQEVINQILNINDINTLLGGGIHFGNVQNILSLYKPNQIHIGTCVRDHKYGPVNQQVLKEFIQKLHY